MNEEELKKGCGKEFYLKQTSKKKSLCNGFGLCPICQAKLSTLQETQKMFLEEIDNKINNIRKMNPENSSGFIEDLEELKSKIGGKMTRDEEQAIEEFLKKRKEIEKFMKEDIESIKSSFKDRLMGKEIEEEKQNE